MNEQKLLTAVLTSGSVVSEVLPEEMAKRGDSTIIADAIKLIMNLQENGCNFIQMNNTGINIGQIVELYIIERPRKG